MPSTRSTKWVFCHYFILVALNLNLLYYLGPNLVLKRPEKSLRLLPLAVRKPLLMLHLLSELSSFFFRPASNAEQILPQSISCQGWEQTPCTSYQWQWNVCVFLSSIFSVSLLIYLFVTVKFLKHRLSTRRQRRLRGLFLDLLSLRISLPLLFRMSFNFIFFIN